MYIYIKYLYDKDVVVVGIMKPEMMGICVHKYYPYKEILSVLSAYVQHYHYIDNLSFMSQWYSYINVIIIKPIYIKI